jgi:hypothetical protein
LYKHPPGVIIGAMKYLKETLSILRETYRGWSQANSVMLAAAL